MHVRAMHCVLAAASALALPPVAAQAQTIAITGGKVYPVSGPPIENGTVIIRDGRITAVGANVAVPEGATRIDATGRWVTPGLINGNTNIGVVEVGAVSETRNENARPGEDNVAAAFTIWEGLNPASVLIPPTREDGITTVVINPGAGLIAGQSAVVDLVEGSVSDMVVRSSAAMVANLQNPRSVGTDSRGELMLRLREVLDDARTYSRNRAAFERAQTREFAASHLDLEALQPVLNGRLPLLVAVDRASDIEAVLKLARDYGIRIIIGGGAEAWQVADKLKAANVPVLTGAMNNIPASFSQLGQRQETAGLLAAAGVRIAIIGNAGGGDEETFNARNVRYEAGNAVAYGMTWDDALRAATLTPAEVFGVADRLGSLQPGKVANVVVWSGDPFEFSTRAEHVIVHGREYRDVSRQDMLTDRYKNLPPNFNTRP